MSKTEPVTGAEFWRAAWRPMARRTSSRLTRFSRRTLIELGTLGVQRVLGHSEKAVAYMADGYARIAGRPGVCRAIGRRGPSGVGSAGCLSWAQARDRNAGHKQPSMEFRNAYQESRMRRCCAGHQILRPGRSGR